MTRRKINHRKLVNWNTMESRRRSEKLLNFYKTLSIRKNNLSELPADLLSLVLAKLSFLDRLRFAAVSSHWRNVYITRPTPLPPQCPCLILPSDNKRSAKLLDLSEDNKKFYDIPMPSFLVDQSVFIGSLKGWLVTVSTKTLAMQLLNPITLAHIPLPSLPFTNPNKSFWNYFKAVLLLEAADDFVVMLSQTWGSGIVWVTEYGSKTWTSITVTGGICDLIQHKNQLYTVNGFGDVQAWDFDGHCSTRRFSITRVFKQVFTGRKYLVLSKTGDLFVIAEQEFDLFPRHGRFTVMQLDESKMIFTWVRDVGEQALFIGNNQGFAVSTIEHPELSSNCVYFACCVGSGIYNIWSGKIRWLSPASDDVLVWPPPIWVTPSLSS